MWYKKPKKYGRKTANNCQYIDNCDLLVRTYC